MRKGRQAGFTLVDLMVGILILGLTAAIAAPSFAKALRNSKTLEASMGLRKIFDASVACYEEEHARRLGMIRDQQFPDAVGPTPSNARSGPVAGEPHLERARLRGARSPRHAYSDVSSGSGADAAFTARPTTATGPGRPTSGSDLAFGQATGGSGIYSNLAIE
jgi:type II secretory pathway pseudopilin PulG